MPDVVVRRATPDEQPLVARLWQLDRHDLSQYRGSTPGPDGLFRPEVVATFFTDPGREAWIIEADGDLAGFCVTRQRDDGSRSVFAFFVLRARRRRGIGRLAALTLLAAEPGPWAIAFQEVNAGAAAFWRGIATEVAGGSWREEHESVPDRAMAETWIRLDTSALRV